MKSVPVVLAVLSFGLACSGGGGGGGGASHCDEGDVDCLVAKLVVEDNGERITLRDLDVELLVPSVSPSGPKSIWALSPNGIDGWDGYQWLTTDDSGDILNSVWAASVTDAWAGGSFRRVKHWNGTVWSTEMESQTQADLIWAVWGSSASDVYAGGEGGYLVHWNGSVWSPVDAGTTEAILAISGSGPSDIWLGGASSLLRHFDGNNWTPVDPNASIDVLRFAVTGPTDAWAVGSNGVTIHWNGSVWAPVTFPMASYVKDVWSSAPNDVWFLGYEISQGTFLRRWNGSAFVPQSGPPGPIELGAVWGRSATDVWVGGGELMGHWNGTAWTTYAKPGLGLVQAIHGAIEDPGGGGGPPTIANQPDSIELSGPDDRAAVTLDWSDPSGCTPAFCFQVCRPNVRCSLKARCTPLIRDGLFSGTTTRTVGYEVADPPPQSFILAVTPVSSTDCEDPIAGLQGGEDELVGDPPTEVEVTFKPPGQMDAGSSTNYDGTWTLEVSISSCYTFTHAVPITISNGSFSGPLFQYCANPVGGETRLGSGDCGSDITEDVSIDLAVDGNDVGGNLTLAGGACNGANGFSGSFTSANAGAAASFWGGLSFSR